MISQPAKFEMPNFTSYGNIKGVTNVENGVMWVVRGSLKVTENSAIRKSAYKFLLAFHSVFLSCAVSEI